MSTPEIIAVQINLTVTVHEFRRKLLERFSDMSLRKSSLGGRPSISGLPLRIRQENTEGHGSRKSTTSSKLRSSGSQSRLSGSSSRQSHGLRESKRFSIQQKTGRTSGIGVRGRTDIPKDPRPIGDRAYQHQCMRKILDYLTRNNYPHAISEKLLAAPPSKDFFRIFEFIYCIICPDYKMGTKMEEEVPRILKMLGYPFTVSKTYLYSVGSPHVWPNLCAALIWMIDLIEMAEGINDQGGVDEFIFQQPMEYEEGGGDQQMEERKLFFEYCEKTYKAFMSGFDTFEDYDEELKALLQKRYQGRDLEEVLEENRNLEEELHILGQTEERLHRVQESVTVGRQNLQKYQNYCAEMEIYKSNLAAKFKTVDEDCAMLDTEFQLKQQELEELKKIYKNQQLMPADVVRMKEESENLKRQIRELEEEEESLDTQIYKVNIDMAKVTEKMTSAVTAYNAGASDLKLIPESAEHANGQDYSLRPSCTSDMNNDIEHTILPTLLQMKKQMKEDMRRINKLKFQRKCEIEQFQETVSDAQEEVNMKKEVLLKLETELTTLKQLSQKQNKSRSSEKSRIEQKIVDLEMELKEAEAAKRQEELEYQSDLKEQDIEQKKFESDLQILSDTRDQIKNSTSHARENLTVKLQKMVAFCQEEDAKMDKQLRELKVEEQRRATWLDEKTHQINKFMNKE